MEEAVGKLWHRLISRAETPRYPKAATHLKDVERKLGTLFRSFGGETSLRIAPATVDTHNARRRLLARIAGVDDRFASGRMDSSTLRLPATIDLFPEQHLNLDLYTWLTALAATHGQTNEPSCPISGNLLRNQAATVIALEKWPGLLPLYQRLVAACLLRRYSLTRLPQPEQAREQAILQALQHPGSIKILPPLNPEMPAPQPIALWLASSESLPAPEPRKNDLAEPEQPSGSTPFKENEESRAYRAQREEMPKEKNGLSLIFRVESLFAVAEFLRINRPVDDEPDPDAADAAKDMDHLSLAQDNDPVASRVRFDLDLPSTADDDIVLGAGLPLPEWDYRKKKLLHDHVRVTEMEARNVKPSPLPIHLKRTAKRLQQQFMALQPERIWLRNRQDGTELDMEAVIRSQVDARMGYPPSEQVYLALEHKQRDLACMVLADLSLSTDTWISSEQRVIDVIQDALLLFGESLCATGDRFAVCGFSSLRRGHVRFHRLKNFNDPFNDQIRGRIAAIKPGYYTRLGAGIRRASQLLEQEKASRRILLILSDGKPNDLDLYEGRYGIEDSRAALHEARLSGLTPFCVTIDKEGETYLPHLFGPAGYIVIRKAQELPTRLPLLYAQLTG